MFQYFAKVVPTRYYYLNGNVLETNQFSVTQNQRVIAGGQHGLPGLFLFFSFFFFHLLIIHSISLQFINSKKKKKKKKNRCLFYI